MYLYVFLLLFIFMFVHADDNIDAYNSLDTLKSKIEKLKIDIKSQEIEKQQLDFDTKSSQESIKATEEELNKTSFQHSLQLFQLKYSNAQLIQLEKTQEMLEKSVDSLLYLYQTPNQDKLRSEIINHNIILLIKDIESHKTSLYESFIATKLALEMSRKKISQLSNSVESIQNQKNKLLIHAKQTKRELLIAENTIKQQKTSLNKLYKQQVAINSLIIRLNTKNTTKITQTTENMPENFTFVKPLSGAIKQVGKQGVLINSLNSDVFCIYGGKILFSGTLAGVGQTIVIDHGNGYTSIYSGIITKIGVGTKVEKHQLIANSGTEKNQPMGGVYFELRHLGTAINSMEIFKD